MNGAVVLLSGGIDSSTLLHYVCKLYGAKNVHALTFRYGQKHSRECLSAKWQAKHAGVGRHVIIQLTPFFKYIAGGSVLTDAEKLIPSLDEIRAANRQHPPTYVPHRNLLFLSLAVSYAEANKLSCVFFAAQHTDSYSYWDCTPEFVKRLNLVLNLNRGNKVTVKAPFIRFTKAQVIKSGLKLGVNFAHTWTCYRGLQKPCMECPSCVERMRAFQQIGVSDPLLQN
jgi:7-cyano-7-deazaguanine synthase